MNNCLGGRCKRHLHPLLKEFNRITKRFDASACQRISPKAFWRPLVVTGLNGFGSLNAFYCILLKWRQKRMALLERKGVETKPAVYTIYSIGHSARRLKEFVSLLKQHGIEALVDVRRFPASRKAPWFDRERLARSLQRAGVRYVWFGELLGGFRKGGYEVHTRSMEFKQGIEELTALAERTPTAFMCAEAVPWRCHRRFIAQALQKRGFKIAHIIDRKRVSTPKEKE